MQIMIVGISIVKKKNVHIVEKKLKDYFIFKKKVIFSKTYFVKIFIYVFSNCF